jgi:hypothetical protein
MNRDRDVFVAESIEFRLNLRVVQLQVNRERDVTDLLELALDLFLESVRIGDNSDNRTETCATGLPPGEVIGSRSPHSRFFR